MKKEFIWTADLLAEFIRDYGDCEGKAADLMEQFKESKQPKPEMLFISKDGAPIHRGQKFYYVDKLYRIGEYWADECWTYGIDGTEFASKLAAEEYVLVNKPLFSVNEIFETMDLQNHFFKNRFIEKAKEKISNP